MNKKVKEYLVIVNDSIEATYNNLDEAIEHAEERFNKVEIDNTTDEWVEWYNGEKTEFNKENYE
tara:strand:+ start:165 stop:356 length:192 start_codon:yes stop_codon:yes gene_type:complete